MAMIILIKTMSLDYDVHKCFQDVYKVLHTFYVLKRLEYILFKYVKIVTLSI